MSKHVYEINLHGEVGADLLAALGAVRANPAPTVTVMITSRLAPDQLNRMIARIVDLGLDVVALRRLPYILAPATV